MAEINLDDYIAKPGKQTVIDTSDPNFGQKWQDVRASNTQRGLQLQRENDIAKQRELALIDRENTDWNKKYANNPDNWSTEELTSAIANARAMGQSTEEIISKYGADNVSRAGYSTTDSNSVGLTAEQKSNFAQLDKVDAMLGDLYNMVKDTDTSGITSWDDKFENWIGTLTGETPKFGKNGAIETTMGTIGETLTSLGISSRLGKLTSKSSKADIIAAINEARRSLNQQRGAYSIKDDYSPYSVSQTNNDLNSDIIKAGTRVFTGALAIPGTNQLTDTLLQRNKGGGNPTIIEELRDSVKNAGGPGVDDETAPIDAAKEVDQWMNRDRNQIKMSDRVRASAFEMFRNKGTQRLEVPQTAGWLGMLKVKYNSQEDLVKNASLITNAIESAKTNTLKFLDEQGVKYNTGDIRTEIDEALKAVPGLDDKDALKISERLMKTIPVATPGDKGDIMSARASDVFQWIKEAENFAEEYYGRKAKDPYNPSTDAKYIYNAIRGVTQGLQGEMDKDFKENFTYQALDDQALSEVAKVSEPMALAIQNGMTLTEARNMQHYAINAEQIARQTIGMDTSIFATEISKLGSSFLRSKSKVLGLLNDITGVTDLIGEAMAPLMTPIKSKVRTMGANMFANAIDNAGWSPDGMVEKAIGAAKKLTGLDKNEKLPYNEANNQDDGVDVNNLTEEDEKERQ